MLRQLFSKLIALVLFCIGLGTTLFFGYECLLCYNASEWEDTQGRIIFNKTEDVPLASLVSEYPMLAEKVPASVLEKNIRQHVIRYHFMVEEDVVTSDRVTFGKLGLLDCLPIGREAQTKEYPVGEIIDVTYDPANPTCAVIDRGMKQEGLIALGLGVFLTILSGGALLSRRRR